jgi:cysteine desulfurase
MVIPIYLDYNATTPIAPAAQQAMLPFLAEDYGNPSSGHILGRSAHAAVEDARARVAELLGARPSEIVFTSGGTESNNLALKGVAFSRRPPGGHLVISALEHPAVAEPARFLQQLGCEVSVVPCNAQGVVEPQEVAKVLRPATMLVSIMHANNEIGTLQPIPEISAICRARGVLVHTDAAQSIGKVPVRADDLGVDLLTLAGHKMYAPKGVGVLYVRQGVRLEPLLHGAGHEGGLRAGTENVPYLAALGQAASVVARHLSEAAGRLEQLRDRLLARLEEGLGRRLAVNGHKAPRLPNTLSVNFPGVAGAELLARCPELCASTGAACHSGTTHMSATLRAIGLSPEAARGTVRLSVGWYTTEEEIDRAASLLAEAWHALYKP